MYRWKQDGGVFHHGPVKVLKVRGICPCWRAGYWLRHRPVR